MAVKNPYDYIAIAVPDVDITLGLAPYNIQPTGEIRDVSAPNQQVDEFDDTSEERISLGDDVSEFDVVLPYETFTAAEIGLIYDLYHDPAKANKLVNSFKWWHVDGPHTYVVRFKCNMERVRQAYDVYKVADITLKILGRIAD